ncbi:MAG: hypothetical protein IJZ16_04235 [Clostridia bacterium]|nr:hypothetical protein [Clostridia bacterium]
MLDSIIWSVFVLLILLGTVAFCYVIMLKLLVPKIKEDYFVIIPCDKASVDVRKKAYGMRMRLNIFGEDVHSKIIVLDYGIDEDEKEQLLEICKECNGIYYVKNQYLKDYFDGRI